MHKLSCQRTKARNYDECLAHLETMFRGRYQMANLVPDISVADFQLHLNQAVNAVEYSSEGFREEQLRRQRDLTIKFTWGHDHDFGSFQLKGRMGRRHLT